MNREYHKWYSNGLKKDMELLVFGHGGRAILFFPTRMARFFDYENWGIIEALHQRIENGELQLFCVDSVDSESFYNKNTTPANRINRHLEYEQYILNEVIPFMRSKNSDGYLEVAGCSMGAYHAANLALKHPQLFKRVVCLSGRYDLTQNIQDFSDLFDAYHNEDIYFNMPQQFLANITDSVQLNTLRKMEIILAIGETDPFIGSNQYLNQLLISKNIPAQFYVWNGFAHRPKYWRQMVNLYL
ncbi:esterase/lipase superfamily enzyme [Mucilaginibacter gracilis]|uniref:Esterase/lipase superfamily enzyme n=1 Tax=Mucilaginibacter gracilis TaxID=423350 RepID=A0A495J3W7_9SPHI|nr:alpha/beta fold hydrolase [Mucilaginibacter gracilis]RKR83676.1 esterase/lipase superfamily enzyme [Mucilaginibacter gracilis]